MLRAEVQCRRQGSLVIVLAIRKTILLTFADREVDAKNSKGNIIWAKV